MSTVGFRHGTSPAYRFSTSSTVFFTVLRFAAGRRSFGMKIRIELTASTQFMKIGTTFIFDTLPFSEGINEASVDRSEHYS